VCVLIEVIDEWFSTLSDVSEGREAVLHVSHIAAQIRLPLARLNVYIVTCPLRAGIVKP
jgi:hypothetical protein